MPLRIAMLFCAVMMGHASLGAEQARPATPREPNLTFAADVGIGRSDNITRVAQAGIEEDIATAGLELEIQRSGPRLTAEILSDLRYFDYLDDTFDSELGGRLDGEIELGVIPERLNWIVEENYGQVAIDIFSVDTPANREYINYFSTGPDVLLNLGSSGFARVFGRYGFTTYEVSPLDGDRSLAGLSAGGRISGGGSLSLTVVGERLRFDDPVLNPEYDRNQAFLRYQSEGARTRIALDVGYTRISDLAYTDGGGFFGIEVAREISASTVLSLDAGLRLTDSSDRFRQFGPGVVAASQAGNVSGTAEVFENRYARLGWKFFRNRTGLDLSLFWSEDVFETSALRGSESLGAEIRLSRQATRALTLSLVGAYSGERFQVPDSDYNESRLGAGARLRLGRRTFFNLDVDRYERTGDEPAREYSENRALLTVGLESR